MGTRHSTARTTSAGASSPGDAPNRFLCAETSLPDVEATPSATTVATRKSLSRRRCHHLRMCVQHRGQWGAGAACTLRPLCHDVLVEISLWLPLRTVLDVLSCSCRKWREAIYLSAGSCFWEQTLLRCVGRPLGMDTASAAARAACPVAAVPGAPLRANVTLRWIRDSEEAIADLVNNVDDSPTHTKSRLLLGLSRSVPAPTTATAFRLSAECCCGFDLVVRLYKTADECNARLDVRVEAAKAVEASLVAAAAAEAAEVKAAVSRGVKLVVTVGVVTLLMWWSFLDATVGGFLAVGRPFAAWAPSARHTLVDAVCAAEGLDLHWTVRPGLVLCLWASIVSDRRNRVPGAAATRSPLTEFLVVLFFGVMAWSVCAPPFGMSPPHQMPDGSAATLWTTVLFPFVFVATTMNSLVRLVLTLMFTGFSAGFVVPLSLVLHILEWVATFIVGLLALLAVPIFVLSRMTDVELRKLQRVFRASYNIHVPIPRGKIPHRTFEHGALSAIEARHAPRIRHASGQVRHLESLRMTPCPKTRRD